jgi:drug/metabolite transporter (DMT)-like permease
VPPRRFPLPNPWLSATVLTWGFNFVAVKLLYQQMTPAAVSIVRFVPMYLLLLLYCALRREPIKYTRESWPVLWQGFVAMGVYMILFLEGMGLSTAHEGPIMLATAPVFSAIFSVIAKYERFTPGAVIGAIIAFIGTAIVIAAGAKGGPSHLWGNVVLIASAIVWAYGAVLSKPLVKKYSPVQSLTMSMPGAFLVLVPYSIWDAIKHPWTPWADLTAQTWWMLLHVIVGAGIIGFVGFYEGVKDIGPAQAMLYQYFVPIVAAVCSYFVFGRSLNYVQAIGLAVVIGGVAFATQARLAAARRELAAA